MSRSLARAIDSIVVVLCLPFYALVWLIMWPAERAERRVTAEVIAKQACPHCSAPLVWVTPGDVTELMLRYRLTGKQRWDRMPQYKVRCSTCQTPIFFDIERRVTTRHGIAPSDAAG